MSISVKISQLNEGGPVASTDQIPVSRGSSETVRIPASQFVVNGTNIGVGTGQLFFDKSTGPGSTLQFRSLSGTDGIAVSNQGNTLVISASGQNPTRNSIVGNGTSRIFTITGATSVNPSNYRVDIDGVLQEPIADYSIVGSTIVFVDPPPNGSKVTVVSNNLVRVFDVIPSDGSVTPQKLNLLSGNVGIGTNTPGANLQVIGSSTTQPAVIITGNTSTYWPQTSLWFNDTAVGGRSYSIGNGGATGTFAIADQTAGQARLTIDSAGRAGIGTTTPSAPLHITGTASSGETLRLSPVAGHPEGGQLTLMDSTGNGGWEIDNLGTGSGADLRIYRDKGVNNIDALVIKPTGDITNKGIPFYGCRAWVNFDGSRNVTNTGASTNGQPVFIRASGNVTSVIRTAPGIYTINFTIPMPHGNYAWSGVTGKFPGRNNYVQPIPDTTPLITTTQLGVFTGNVDETITTVTVFC